MLSSPAASARADSHDPSDTGDAAADDTVPTRNGRVLRNQLGLELMGFITSNLSVRYERALGRYFALALQPMWGWGTSEPLIFSATLQARWYPEGHAMRGWYVSPQLGYVWQHGRTYDATLVTDHMGTGVLTGGYNWSFAQAVSLYLGAGIGFGWGSNRLDELLWDFVPLFAHGWYPSVEFGVGIPF